MSHSAQTAGTSPSWGGPLTEADYANLAKSWITSELADLAMLSRVTDAEGAEVLGRRDIASYSGIAYPYVWPGEDRIREYFVRRDRPEIEYDAEGKPKEKGKYLGPPGRGNLLYIMPGTAPELLADLNVPIVITEGAKKTIALHRLSLHGLQETARRARFIPVGLSGAWSFRGTIGKTNGPDGSRRDETGLITDLRRLPMQGRVVYVLFDSNVHTNPKIAAARRQLSHELAVLGAQVQWVNLPTPTEEPSINGVDDLLAIWGPERVLGLFDKAQPPTRDRRNQAESILRLAEGIPLFHTPEFEAFALVAVGSHKEVLILRSNGFIRWLRKLAYKKLGKPPSEQALQEAIGILEAQALFDAPEAHLFVRVAEHENRTYIDLCNHAGEVVEIDASGWRIVTDPPVYFRRTKGLRMLPRPVMGGSIIQLRRFLNIGDETNWILLLSWLMAAYRGHGPYPILILQGEQGSAKSTMARIVRMLIDPSPALVRTPPRDERDLLITANNSWLLAYDNLSRLPQWLSDALCRLATGGGFSTRSLYTDADELFVDASRPVILNGIDHLASRPDLAERAVFLELPSIQDGERKEEADLYAELDKELPEIFGALLTALSGALVRLPTTKLNRRPRMADFAHLATAAEEPLGFTLGAFMAAYCGNRADAVRETLEADPVGAAIIAMMDRRFENQETRWQGTSKELKVELEKFVDEGTTKASEWPRTACGLAGRLRRLVTFLRESDIRITFPRKGAKGRRVLTLEVVVQTTATSATSATQPSEESADQSDTREASGGGRNHQLADAPPSNAQPPPVCTVSAVLNGHEIRPEVAEVAKVAVKCTQNLDGESATSTHGRIDVCNGCGRADWEWNGSAWVCRHCGSPAPDARPRDDIERIVL